MKLGPLIIFFNSLIKTKKLCSFPYEGIKTSLETSSALGEGPSAHRNSLASLHAEIPP